MRNYADYQHTIEAALKDQLLSLGEIPVRLRDSMLYSLQAGGKRLRPVLLLAAGDELGAKEEALLPFACALEMIHTYSLIHDDLPAMDNDDLRRGKSTNHKVFGEGLAILAGDGLLSAAMELMARTACSMQDLRGIKACEAIARRAGVCGMVAGQTVDVTEQGSQPTPEKVLYIHQHKTADLLTAPMEAAAILANADDRTLNACIQYGQHLGLAFQMVDDLLDVEGDAAILGKNTGMDASLGKLTWIAVHGIEQTHKDAAEHIRLAVQSASIFEDSMKFFSGLAVSTLNRVQ